jgi:hypothetical protein
VQIKGRVADLETCVTLAGCSGMAEVRVTLLDAPTVVSDPTPPSGAFTLAGVPDGQTHHLAVINTSSGGAVVPTLQARTVAPAGGDIYGLELFTLRKQGGLYSGFSQEAGVEVNSHLLYVGQVYRVEGGVMKALSDVAVAATPSAEIRYVNCIPSFSQCAGQTTLFESRSQTGSFGQFVAIGKAGAGDYSIAASGSNLSFDPVGAALRQGYLTLGLHQAK